LPARHHGLRANICPARTANPDKLQSDIKAARTSSKLKKNLALKQQLQCIAYVKVLFQEFIGVVHIYVCNFSPLNMTGR